MDAIYVHVPFCRRRCSYCDFYFVTGQRHVQEYVEAVSREIELRSQSVDRSVPVRTVYFGGGTPTRLTTEQIGEIVSTLRRCFDLRDLREMSIEVNPEDPDRDYLARLRDLGFTRISIGIQSLYDRDLRFMNRAHSSEQARDFVALALASDFDSVSLDLIFGLPEMSEDEWSANLEYAVASGVQHVSLYGLTIEPGTPLGKWVRDGAVRPAGEETLERQFRMAHATMSDHGFEHYEISNFAKPGHRSRHNESYWNHTNYLGFGPSAHSFVRDRTANRWENVRSLRQYLQHLSSGKFPESLREDLDVERLMQEYVFLGLRTDRGIDLSALATDYGHRLTDEGEDLVSELVAAGKMTHGRDRIRLTLDGFLVADGVTSALLTGNAIGPVT